MAQQPPQWQPPERWQGPYPTTPMTPLSEQERKVWLAQQVDAHLRAGWRIDAQTENVVTLSRGRPINHVLHLLLTLVTCGVWAVVWIVLALTAGEKYKTLSTRDADHRPQGAATNNQRTLLIVVGVVFGFIILMSIIGSLTS